MKYVRYLCLIIIMVISVIIFNFNSDNEEMPVMSVDSLYKVFTIYTENMTTKNINKYFDSNDDFVAIYPKVNPLYKKKIGNVVFNSRGDFDIKDFEKFYRKILEQHNYKEDLINTEYYGVSIEKIKIYANRVRINNILKKCSSCKLESD